MKRDTLRQIAVIVSVIAVIVINSLANILPLNGQTTGEISDRFQVYFTPAGYVFSIWSLIYVGLIAYAIFQALPAQRENPRLRAIGSWFVISSAANIAWLFFWHYELFVLTQPMITLLLVALIVIYLRLRSVGGTVTRAERWFVWVPFSIYMGWLTVANIANLTALLYYLGWNGQPLSPEVWMPIVLAAAVVIAGLVAYYRRDTAYLLVLVWAFIGIALKHAGVPLVTVSAWVATALVAVMAVWTVIKPMKASALTESRLKQAAR